MGMGYCADNAYTISIENMRKLLPVEMGAFEKTIENADETMEYIFRELSFDGKLNDKCVQSLEKLNKSFEELTNVGGKFLSILPTFHDSDDQGDRYDTVNGAFFIVTRTHKPTKPYMKFKEYISDSYWVNFG